MGGKVEAGTSTLPGTFSTIRRKDKETAMEGIMPWQHNASVETDRQGSCEVEVQADLGEKDCLCRNCWKLFPGKLVGGLCFTCSPTFAASEEAGKNWLWLRSKQCDLPGNEGRSSSDSSVDADDEMATPFWISPKGFIPFTPVEPANHVRPPQLRLNGFLPSRSRSKEEPTARGSKPPRSRSKEELSSQESPGRRAIATNSW